MPAGSPLIGPMSAVPIRPTNALLNSRIVGRSLRQCSGSSIPRSVWVVIGPFWGSNPRCEAQTDGSHSSGWPSAVRVDGHDEAHVVVGIGVRRHRAGRVSEIPAQPVHVSRDVAARACRVAVAGGVDPVVEKPAAGAHHIGARVVQRHLVQLGQPGGIDHRHRVRKAQQHVEPAFALVKRHACRPLADLDHLRCRAGRAEDTASRRAAPVDHEKLARSDRRQVARAAVGLPDHHPRLRNAGGALGQVGRRIAGTNDVLVQVDESHRVARRRIDDREAVIDDMALHSQRVLEAHVVARLGVGVRRSCRWDARKRRTRTFPDDRRSRAALWSDWQRR